LREDAVENIGRIISDESTFHISGKVNRHVHAWGTEQPHAQTEHQCDSPKVNVFCAVPHDKVHGAFFFTDETSTGGSFLDILGNWLLPPTEKQLKRLHSITGRSSPTPQFSHECTSASQSCSSAALDRPCCSEDNKLSPWPPRSPDLTPCDLFLWGFVKDSVMCHHCPHPSRNLVIV
jgi:hypothetical protein